MTERELVEMVLSGRLEAFEPLVLPYRAALVGLACRLLGDREEAVEAAQDALFKAFRYLARFDASRSFRNWLFRIVVNEARDRARRRSRERTTAGLLIAFERPASDPEDLRRDREFRDGILKCLDVLTPHEREVFTLRDLEDLNVKETAGVLGCSNVSVRVSLSSARRKIRDAIRARYPHLEEGR